MCVFVGTVTGAKLDYVCVCVGNVSYVCVCGYGRRMLEFAYVCVGNVFECVCLWVQSWGLSYLTYVSMLGMFRMCSGGRCGYGG